MPEAVLSGSSMQESQWSESCLKLRSNGTWVIKESAGYEDSHARGNSEASGGGTWAVSADGTCLVLAVLKFDSGNSDARAPKQEEVGKTYSLELAALKVGNADSPFFQIKLKCEGISEFLASLGQDKPVDERPALRSTAARLLSWFGR
ncbi:unnamed protein product [Effrenium voratum]|uniref:Uncharacterized protein n=1 Tax=Effrenium voratum TaxID=2562239 RepID=A0AA36I8V6_9DINO|nr:unnamed protein product [Effrenium voratum]